MMLRHDHISVLPRPAERASARPGWSLTRVGRADPCRALAASDDAGGDVLLRSRWSRRSAAETRLDGGAHVGGALHNADAGRLERGHLLGGGALATRDDRAGVAHAAARGGRLTGDEADDRLL